MPVRLTYKTALLAAAVAAGLLLLTWLAEAYLGPARQADGSILLGFVDVAGHSGVKSVADRIASLCDPIPYLLYAWIPIAVALLRGRPRVALAIAVILLGANVTTHLLKPLLAHPRPKLLLGVTPFGAVRNTVIAPASWPSGHATAAMSFVLCAILASPQRARPFVVAAGAVFAVAVCYSFLALGWHYPSDVLGGFLVATVWTLLAISALLAVEHRELVSTSGPRPRLARELGPPALTVVGAAVIALLIALARPHAVVTFARSHEAFMLGASVIGVVALALATGLMLAVRR
jgi:membrane-associated phospholipid phosphatase